MRMSGAVMFEQSASDVARCGDGQYFSLFSGWADDVGPSWCVVIPRGGRSAETSQQRSLEWPHVGSVERMAHRNGVG